MNSRKGLVLNKFYLFVGLIVFSFFGCNYSTEEVFVKRVNSFLKEQKKNFGKDYKIENLLEHFPKKITSIDTAIFQLFSAPPSCPPSFKCSVQFGDIYLICNTEDSKVTFTLNNILYKTKYTNVNNIILNTTELRREIFPVDKCNKWFAEKYPIPYFESFDFGLGDKESKTIVEGETYFNYTHTIPSDLEVFVISAEHGNFWKESCNEKRPESLKEWKNGYSRGIAISKKSNLIVYWTIIW